LTETRDVYLITKTDAPDPNKPLNNITTATETLAELCRVNPMGLQQQRAFFAGKIYSSAKVVIVPGRAKADALAFADEYDTDKHSGVVYDITLVRNHTNSTAFYIVNTRAGVANG
jgi:hypothetical protein